MVELRPARNFPAAPPAQDRLLQESTRALNLIARARSLGHEIPPEDWRVLENTVMRALRAYQSQLYEAQQEKRRLQQLLEDASGKLDSVRALRLRLKDV